MRWRWMFPVLAMMLSAFLVASCGGDDDDNDDSADDDDTDIDDDTGDDTADDDTGDDTIDDDTVDDDTVDDDTGDDDTTPQCVDVDGDTYGENCAPGPDCDDNDPNNWESCDTCVDGDTDGAFVGCDAYTTIDGPDCDDNNPDRFPGQTELCNGIDDACAGTLSADERDDDGDGFVACLGWTGGATNPDVIAGGDCDDTDPNTHPGAAERCDGNDNACLGWVPENEMDGDGDYYVSCTGWSDTQNDDPSILGGEDCDDTDDQIIPDGYFCGDEFHYTENFDTSDGGWLHGGIGNTWEWGEPMGSFISSAASPPNAWVTNLDGAYNNGEEGSLVLPEFDMTDLTVDPTVSFNLIRNTESCCDRAWLEVSYDIGASWQHVGTYGTGANWYTDSYYQAWNANSTGWVHASNTLAGAAGEPEVALVFRFHSDSSITYEGVGIDDFTLSTLGARPSATMQSVTIQGDTSACGLSAAEVVRVVVKFENLSEPLTDLEFAYAVNGEAVAIENVDASGDPINSGDTVTYDFTTPADLTGAGLKVFSVSVIGTGPSSRVESRGAGTVQNIPIIDTFPYREDFEGAFHGWSAFGNTSFALGTPAGPTLAGAYSGANAWDTNPAGAYNNSEFGGVLSPCFDFSSFGSPSDPDPWVAIARGAYTESSFDGARLDYTVDDGATWTTVGNTGIGFNWYNNTSCYGLTQGDHVCWSGTLPWAMGSMELAGLRAPVVRFRVVFGSDSSVTYEGFAFDDFAIAVPSTDLAITEVVAPADVCAATGSQTLTIRVTSVGGPYDGGDVEVSQHVGAGPLVEETITAPVIPFNGSIDYTFHTAADFAYYEEPKLTVTISAPGDTNPANDTLVFDCSK